MRRILPILLLAAFAPLPLSAQAADTAGYTTEECESCATWNEPQDPFRIHGDTYYVGTRGLAAILIASDDGHVLIDGGLPNSAPRILANIEALGFDPADVELILNSHAHFDHAGGIAALQRATGATVAASPASAPVIESGASGRDDPQYGVALDFPAASDVRVFSDGETLRVGSLEITAHLTPGHTPGGTTWTWRSCEEGSCVSVVYADSQTPISADGFRFSDSETYPTALEDFERAFAVLENLPCDLLLTPHPAASGMWDRLEAGSLIDPDACRDYAAAGRESLARRLARERAEG